MSDDPVEVGGVANVTDQAGDTVEVVIDREVVKQRPQEAGGGTTFDDDLVGGRCVHTDTIGASATQRIT